MTAPPPYQTAADVFEVWRAALFSRAAPPLYAIGTGALATVEIGPGRVVLVGGLPGGGKTALAMQWVIEALRNVPTLRAVVANVEMSPAVLLDRQLARLSGVPLDAIAKRKLGAEHADRIDRGLATLESVAGRLAFVAPPIGLDQIAATADDFRGSLLLLDYLQRIRPPGEHADKRGSVDALMDYLRRFADAGCAVLAVSAMARTKDRRGRSSYESDGLSLASYRESSELEYGADTAYVLAPNHDNPEAVTLRCLKHRHGEPVDVNLLFERRVQSFRPVEAEPATVDRGKLTASLRALWGSTPAAADDDGGDE